MMEKLSRTTKYKNYRDGMNSDSEREIATKELKDLQNKIIFNEKRFGNSSRTENDLQRGSKETSYDNFYDNYFAARNDSIHTPNENEYREIDDIFGEIDKYRNNRYREDDYDEYRENNRRQSNEFDDKDEYIRKIREIVNNAGGQSKEPVHHETYSREDRYNVERTFEREKFANQDIIYREDKFNELVQQKNELEQELKAYREQSINNVQLQNNEIQQQQEIVSNVQQEPVLNVQQEPAVAQEPVVKQEPNFNVKQEYVQELQPEIGFNAQEPIHNLNRTIAPEPVVQSEPEEIEEEYISPMAEIVLEKPEIKSLVPQRDNSNEFKEICDNANALADEIESSSSFAENTYIPHAVSHAKNNSLEGLQNDINKDLINSKNINDFMQAVELEVDQYNKEDENNSDSVEEEKIESIEEIKTAPKKSEVAEEMKEEYNNTISLEVNKLMDEINTSRFDDISVDEIIKENSLAKKEFDDTQLGKTIAFDIDDNDIVPDNTIVLSKPEVLEDSSIHTMSFQTEELDEKEDKNSVLLNIILTILIIIAIAALGVMAYFFLITRGII